MSVAEVNRVAEIRNLGGGPLFLEIWSVLVICPPPFQKIETNDQLWICLRCQLASKTGIKKSGLGNKKRYSGLREIGGSHPAEVV